MRHTLSIVVFIGILFWSFTALNSFLYDKIDNWEAPGIYKEQFGGKEKGDIIVLGTSHGAHAFGYESNKLRSRYVVKNFSFSASCPEYHYKWYTTYFKKYYGKKPSLVIYSTDWFIFDGGVLTKKFEHDSYCIPSNIFYKELLSNPDMFSDMIINRYPLIKINKDNMSHLPLLWKFKWPVINFTRNVHAAVPTAAAAASATPPAASFNEDTLQNKLSIGKIDDNQLYYFLLLLEELKKDNIPVLLVQVPEYLPGSYSSNFTANNDFIEYLSKLYSINYINYNNESKSGLNYDKNYFIDWGHLNNHGREVFLNKFNNHLNLFFDDLLKGTFPISHEFPAHGQISRKP